MMDQEADKRSDQRVIVQFFPCRHTYSLHESRIKAVLAKVPAGSLFADLFGGSNQLELIEKGKKTDAPVLPSSDCADCADAAKKPR